VSRREHKLKTATAFYQALQDGRKTFEIRFNDRDYRVGDYLHLCQWDGERFTGRNVWRRVSYVLTWGEFPGLASGYVCMGFDEPASALETRTVPEAPEKMWNCVICSRSNYVTSTHCAQCDYSRMVTRQGVLVPREDR
jgi:hypothetical protein